MLGKIIKKIDEPLIRMCKYFYIHPNALTLARIGLIPFIILSYFKGYRITALIIFVFSWLLDLFDGPMARAHNVTSTLGAFLDPFADKLLFIICLSPFYLNNQVNSYLFWLLTIVESNLVLIRIIKLIQKKYFKMVFKDIKALPIGKVKSIVEQLAVALLLLVSVPSELFNEVINIMLGAALALAMQSFYQQFKNITVQSKKINA